MLKVSNLGSGVVSTVLNSEWQVRLPQILQDRGPCTVRLVKGRIQCANSVNFDDVSKVWCETSIPIQGVSTEVPVGQASTNYTELFDVELLPAQPTYLNQNANSRQATSQNYRALPYEFRCGGLPAYINFRAMCLSNTLDIGDTLVYSTLDSVMNAGGAIFTPQVEFHLAIVFDSTREK